MWSRRLICSLQCRIPPYSRSCRVLGFRGRLSYYVVSLVVLWFHKPFNYPPVDPFNVPERETGIFLTIVLTADSPRFMHSPPYSDLSRIVQRTRPSVPPRLRAAVHSGSGVKIPLNFGDESMRLRGPETSHSLRYFVLISCGNFSAYISICRRSPNPDLGSGEGASAIWKSDRFVNRRIKIESKIFLSDQVR